ncbi:MAG: DUF2844 domain-containing protein [Burkholderiales bacterium]|nr:DUF2844 domain-containing protein [Burkholderiales bacterium]
MNKLKFLPILLMPMTTFATLGQDMVSVAKDAVNLGIVDNTAHVQTAIIESSIPNDNNTYSIYQMTTTSGIEIKQYIADDKVFAITWQGESSPNLNQLLGKYFHTYTNATPKYKSSALLRIEDQDLIIYYGNIDNYFYGRAIISTLVPSGLSMIKIK